MIFDTVAAIATPPGSGGIAVIRVSGPDSYTIAQKVFLPKNADKNIQKIPGYSALYGDIKNGATKIDSGIALFFRAPNSYTGEDCFELSCHGGEVVSRGVLDACIAAGAAPAGPGEFTKRAVLNGKLNITQAEAVLDLIEATGEQAARQATAALDGALASQIQTVRESLIQLAGHLAAYVDYPEEDVEELSPQNFTATIEESLQTLRTLANSYSRGSIIRRGVQTVIIGSPNVGKSTLFNLLSGFQRSIVTPVAGTTRDVVREHINVRGITLHVSDTAGLHQSEDMVEAEGIKRSYEELQAASLVLAVFDGSSQTGEEDSQLAKQCAGRPAIAIINKSDLPQSFNAAAIEPYFTKVLQLSALDQSSVAALEEAILTVLQLESFDANAAAITTERQYFSLKRSIEALEQSKAALRTGMGLDAAGVCLDDGLAALSELRGDIYSDDVINDVFTRFCVGK